MGLLSFLKDERIVFVGLGLTTLASIRALRFILEYYRDEAEIKPVQPKTQYITQDTEDALEISTLVTLLGHYNFSIKDTALKIAAGRAVNDTSVIDHLLWGITRKDYDERTKCLRTLAFAVEDKDTVQDPLSVLNNAKGYSALVRSLELSLDDCPRESLSDPLYDEYYLRDIGERRCIMLVSQLIHKYGVDKLVQAKFVEKWLAKQKWGDKDEERLQNFAQYMDRRKNRVTDICSRLSASKVGRKALRQAKLLGKGYLRPRDRSGSQFKVILEISMTNEENGEIQQANFESELTPRVVEQTAEEQRRRRRHREAIVMNDGTHSLGRGDIIERENDTNT